MKFSLFNGFRENHEIVCYNNSINKLHQKYGSWRFCVKYRTLNDKPVKDSFSMHTVDELLCPIMINLLKIVSLN